MALCWSNLLHLLSYALVVNATALNYTLTSEITSFIPSCAQECFKSFLDANVPTTACSKTPTLACLCSHSSPSGYTVGEGAVQCIISEVNIGFCKGNDARESVAISAYNMCNGKVDALPNTHGTITATLIVQTSMPSIVLVAPIATVTSIPISTAPKPTRSSSSSSSSSPSSNSGSSSSSKLPSTTLFTATFSPSQSNIAASTVSSLPAAETAVPSPVLTKPQLVGVTVASIGGGCAIIGALIFCICLRRRKQRKMRESDLLPFQLDPPSHLMDKRKYNYSFRGPTERRPGGTVNGIAARIAPRIPPRIDTSSPNMFSRRSIRPDTIGVAISPESNVAIEKQQRRSSKLLPDKPSLTLRMPQSPRGAGLSFSQPMGLATRQSTATNFEEDEFDSADTAVNADDSWGRRSTERILDNPTTNWPAIRIVDPEPTKTAAFIDGGGEYHWRPPQASSNITKPSNIAVVAPDYYIKPLNLSRGMGSFSQPRRLEATTRPPEKSLQLTIPNQAIRPVTSSSSVYSGRASLPGSENGRQGAPRTRKSYRQSGPYDSRQSSGSLTSFDSLDSGFSPVETEPRTAGMDLSPVVESPVSGGISPVTYPKIPGRLSGTAIRMMPPPPQPDFSRALGPAGTIAGPGIKPWRQAEIAAQRERERLNRQSQDQTRAAARELQIQVGMQSTTPTPEYGHYRKRSSDSRNIYAFPAPPEPILRSQTAPPTEVTGGFGLGSRVNQLAVQPEISFTRSSSQLSQYSQASKNSTSSSLLAKRLGESKAAALTLKSSEEERRKWRVLKKEEIELAKAAGWKPMLGSGSSSANQNQIAGGGPGQRSDGVGGEEGRRYAQLQTPTTPGWMPRLTPTRRGDELFLSVQ